MPSKEQKKLNKKEENEIKRLAVQEKIMEELEWEKGTDKRGIQRKQQELEKMAEKLRQKQERQEQERQEQEQH
jgi:hypothetical protein